MHTANRNRRRDERVRKELPMALGSASGVIHDVSASGMYFETDMPYAVGSEIRFSVDLRTPDGDTVLRCRGEIVRVKPQSGRMGMAVKILESVTERN